jgi:hypothetical protein
MVEKEQSRYQRIVAPDSAADTNVIIINSIFNEGSVAMACFKNTITDF